MILILNYIYLITHITHIFIILPVILADLFGLPTPPLGFGAKWTVIEEC